MGAGPSSRHAAARSRAGALGCMPRALASASYRLAPSGSATAPWRRLPHAMRATTRRLRHHVHLGAPTEPAAGRSLADWAGDLVSLTQAPRVTEAHGGELVAQTLVAHGVQFIFCLSGGHISPILVSSKQCGIRIIDVRHEVNAVFAADAVGRLTGQPGVAAVTAGPGVTNTITALKNAQMAQSPIVLLGGAAATIMQGRGSLQDIEQMGLIAGLCKWSYSCRSARDIVPTLRKAFQEACSGVPGPVFVELPLDVLYPVTELMPQAGTHVRFRASELQPQGALADDAELLSRVVVPDEAEAAGMDARSFIASKGPDMPVFAALKPEDLKVPLPIRAGFELLKRRLHSNMDPAPDFSPLPIMIPMPDGGDVAQAAELLAAAKRPLFLLGSQAVLLGPERAEELAAALSTLGAPCFLGGMARGLFGRHGPCHIRQNRGQALKKCDLVIMLGVVADFRLDYGRALPGRTPIVSVNRSTEDLHKNSTAPVSFWSAELSSLADPCLFCLELCAAATPKPEWGAWVGDLKAAERTKEVGNDAKRAELALGRGGASQPLLNPIELLSSLEASLPDDAILVADGGDFIATSSYILRPRGPLRWLDPGAFGTLGVGGGFALGAKLVRPEAQVWLLWGDGSAGYSLAEFDTFTRHNVPVIALIGNDAGWTQIEREQVPMFQDPAACVLEYLPYEQVAIGYGGKGLSVGGGGGTPEEENASVAAAIEQAQVWEREGHAVCINALVGGTNFREGSLSV